MDIGFRLEVLLSYLRGYERIQSWVELFVASAVKQRERLLPKATRGHYTIVGDRSLQNPSTDVIWYPLGLQWRTMPACTELS